ncbi:MAG: hypothetical protein HC802_19035, partial [Caldilineaceae bacterium]|nr:hypothetical protein [Caldilineaceae bacterium]
IDQITEVYVHYRFSRQEGLPASAMTEETLNSSWRELRPLFFQTWLRKRLRFGREKKHPFALVGKSGK